MDCTVIAQSIDQNLRCHPPNPFHPCAMKTWYTDETLNRQDIILCQLFQKEHVQKLLSSSNWSDSDKAVV